MFSSYTKGSIVAASALALVLGLAQCASYESETAITPRPAVTEGSLDASVSNTEPPQGGSAPAGNEDDLDQTDNSDDDTGGGGGASPPPEPPDNGEGGELEPVNPPASGPCTGIDVTTSSAIVVLGDPVVLKPGKLTGAVRVVNCSEGDVDWTAKTVANVQVAGGGNLAAGVETNVDFAIDGKKFEPGAIDFKIKVSEPGHNHYVDVHAFRPLTGADLVGGRGLAAASGSGGCANSCIRSAVLTPNATSPNLKLTVATTVGATVKVWASTDPPQMVGGIAKYPGKAPRLSSNRLRTTYNGSLKNLQAATTYHIVVAATDAAGKTTTRWGTFRTTTPVDLPSGQKSPDGPVGCKVQCITKAMVTPTTTYSRLDVQANTAALFNVYLSTHPPQIVDGRPTFTGSDATSVADSGALESKTWTTKLTGLTPNTKYFVIVRASDLAGGTSYQHGSFGTPDGRRWIARFETIKVLNDGDAGVLGKGELSFAWGIEKLTMRVRPEAKIDGGQTISLGAENTGLIVADHGGPLTDLMVTAYERDPDGLSEFNSCGDRHAHTEAGSAGACDRWWNSAFIGIYNAASIDLLAPCSTFGIREEAAASKCMEIQSPDTGNGRHPRFRVVISFTEQK